MGTLLRDLIQIAAHFHQGGFVLKLADEVRERQQADQHQMALRADARFGDVLERRAPTDARRQLGGVGCSICVVTQSMKREVPPGRGAGYQPRLGGGGCSIPTKVSPTDRSGECSRRSGGNGNTLSPGRV